MRQKMENHLKRRAAIVARAELIASQVNAIKARVGERFGVDMGKRSSRKGAENLLARQVAMYLCRKLTTASFPEIGRHFGDLNHATVMHAVEKVEGLLETDLELAGVIKEFSWTAV